MDDKGFDELYKTYLVARLNWEKSERTVGQLARFLANQAIAARLVMICVEQGVATGTHHFAYDEPSDRAPARMEPLPFVVREALKELRVWRAATRQAYDQIAAAERATMPRPISTAGVPGEISLGVHLA